MNGKSKIKRYPTVEHLKALKDLLHETQQNSGKGGFFASRRSRLRSVKKTLADIYKQD